MNTIIIELEDILSSIRVGNITREDTEVSLETQIIKLKKYKQNLINKI